MARNDSAGDNRLAFMDQAAFLSMRATGLGQVMQFVWVYEHPVDMSEVRRFHRDFGHGLFGRLIERSPLPFGRHRWVSAVGPAAPIDIAETARPRVELGDWADERAEVALDPEHGPGWHMGVVPLSDGSTAVTLVASHCLSDGIGAMTTIANVVEGEIREIDYPLPRSRTRRTAIASDLRQTARAVPEIARAFRSAAKVAVRRRHDLTGSPAPRATDLAGQDGDVRVVVPAVSFAVDANELDTRAEQLGGNSYSLVAGFAAKLAEATGRLKPDDGTATLNIPISDREPDDTRAIAMPFATARVHPGKVTVDLSDARVAVRQALKEVRATPDETTELLPLIQLIPDRAMNRVADAFLGSAELPVSCSNLGDLPPAANRIDGTEAEYFLLRGLNQHVNRRTLEKTGGQLFLAAGRIHGKVTFTVGSYQPGAENSKPFLRDLVVRTLAEFGLTATMF